MFRFTVGLYKHGRALDTDDLFPVWSFSPAGDEPLPPDFGGFDITGCSMYGCVWVADNTQALVAYDWLLENGWELSAEPESYTDTAAFLNLLAATADR